MAESGRVPGKRRIRASIEKLSRRVLENGRICVSTENWQNPGEYHEKVNPCEYRKRVLTSTGKGLDLCQYRKMGESGRVPGKGRIRASIEKLSGGVPKNGRICVSTEKRWNPGEYRENVESMQV